MTLVSDTLASVMFLSRLPVHLLRQSNVSGPNAVPDFLRTAYTFPLAGLIIAIPAASFIWLTVSFGVSPLVSAFLAVGILCVTTGALHEDGLADCADGFWGGHTQKRKLEIMRDSAIGTYGVLSLVLVVGCRIALLATLIEALGLGAAVVVLAASSLSRLFILQPWYLLPAARDAHSDNKSPNGKDKAGLSVRYGAPDSSVTIKALLCTLPAFALLFATVGFWPACLALVFGQVAVALIVYLGRKHIGGQTGDVLGATQQISELGLFLGLAWSM